MDELESVQLPDAHSARITQAQLYGMLERDAPAGEHHTSRPARCTAARCSRGAEMLMFVEDVGRHNAIDTIAGWMWLHGVRRRPTRSSTPPAA